MFRGKETEVTEKIRCTISVPSKDNNGKIRVIKNLQKDEIVEHTLPHCEATKKTRNIHYKNSTTITTQPISDPPNRGGTDVPTT